MFVAHANGKPLQFEWIYSDGSLVPIDNIKFVSDVNPQSNYNNTGIDVFVGTLTINNLTENDDAAYAVRIDGSGNNFNCPIAVSNSFNLDVNPLPDAPGIENIAYCLGDTATVLTATGSNLTWYDSNMNALSVAPTPGTNVVGTTSYFVTQKDSFCESEPAEIVVTINDLPGLPPLTETEKNIAYCLGETATALLATADTGSTVNWYGPGDSDLALTEAPTPSTQAEGDLEYWVSQTNENNCEGPKEKVTVFINNLPIVTITNPGSDTICAGDSVTLTATDSNTNGTNTGFSWISSEDPGNPVNRIKSNL